MKYVHKWGQLYFLTALIVLSVALCLSKTVTVVSEVTPIHRKHCIVIDAGHGGIDGGAISCTGKLESAYNLEIALRLEDLLHLLGYDTNMIRRSDISIYKAGSTISQKKISDLKERVQIVNQTENAVLLSIHQNSFADSRSNGAQVFYSNTPGSPLLAKMLQERFRTSLNPGSNRREKASSGVYLMEHIHQTGVLVECGFLTNEEEARKLDSDEYQKKICSVIASGISCFLSNT